MPYTLHKSDPIGNIKAISRLLDAGWATLKHAITEGRDVTDAEMTALHMVFCPEYKLNAAEMREIRGPGIGIGADMGGGKGAGDKR